MLEVERNAMLMKTLYNQDAYVLQPLPPCVSCPESVALFEETQLVSH